MNLGRQQDPLKALLDPNHGQQVIQALSESRISTDKHYFERKTYEEFMMDPLGNEYRKNKVQLNDDIRSLKLEQETLKNKI